MKAEAYCKLLMFKVFKELGSQSQTITWWWNVSYGKSETHPFFHACKNVHAGQNYVLRSILFTGDLHHQMGSSAQGTYPQLMDQWKLTISPTGERPECHVGHPRRRAILQKGQLHDGQLLLVVTVTLVLGWFHIICNKTCIIICRLEF